MAGFCHWWKMTPPEYWALTISEASAMFRHMEQTNERKRRQQAKADTAARRRARGRR